MKKTKLATTGGTPATPRQEVSAPEDVQSPSIDWSQYAGQPSGFENTTQEDLGIPFLMILQKGSPEVDKSHKDYQSKKIEDAEVGDIINTLSREIVHSSGNEPVLFVPCGYVRSWVEWKPRGSGGGMVKSHKDSRILEEVVQRDEQNHDILRNGNILVTTAYFFGLIVSNDESELPPQQAVVSMSATQLKKARFWLNLMAGIRLGPNRICPPMYSHKYALSTIPESNAKGTWFGWKIENAGVINDPDLVKEGSDICMRVANSNKPLLKAPTSEVEPPM